MNKLNIKTLSSFNERNKDKETIVGRIHYILEFLFKSFNAEGDLQTWYFDGADEGEMGELVFDDDYIHNIILCAPADIQDSIKLILKDGSEFSLDGTLPTRWLTEDFEDEVIQGIEKYKQHEANKAKVKEAKKAAKKLQDIKDKQEFEIIKLKLSNEELRILRKYLK